MAGRGLHSLPYIRCLQRLWSPHCRCREDRAVAAVPGTVEVVRYFSVTVLLVVGGFVHLDIVCGAWQVWEAKVTWRHLPGPVRLAHVDDLVPGTAEGVHDGALDAQKF